MYFVIYDNSKVLFITTNLESAISEANRFVDRCHIVKGEIINPNEKPLIEEA